MYAIKAPILYPVRKRAPFEPKNAVTCTLYELMENYGQRRWSRAWTTELTRAWSVIIDIDLMLNKEAELLNKGKRLDFGKWDLEARI